MEESLFNTGISFRVNWQNYSNQILKLIYSLQNDIIPGETIL